MGGPVHGVFVLFKGGEGIKLNRPPLLVGFFPRKFTSFSLPNTSRYEAADASAENAFIFRPQRRSISNFLNCRQLLLSRIPLVVE